MTRAAAFLNRDSRVKFVGDLFARVPLLRPALLRTLIGTWRSSLKQIVDTAASRLQAGDAVAGFAELVLDGLEYLVLFVARAFVQMLGTQMNCESALAFLEDASDPAAAGVALAAVGACVPLPREQQLRFLPLSGTVACPCALNRVPKLPFCTAVFARLKEAMDAAAILAVAQPHEQRAGRTPQQVLLGCACSLVARDSRLTAALAAISGNPTLLAAFPEDMLAMHFGLPNLSPEVCAMFARAVEAVAGAVAKLVDEPLESKVLVCQLWVCQEHIIALRDMSSLLGAVGMDAGDLLAAVRGGAAHETMVAFEMEWLEHCVTLLHRRLCELQDPADLPNWARFVGTLSTAAALRRLQLSPRCHWQMLRLLTVYHFCSISNPVPELLEIVRGDEGVAETLELRGHLPSIGRMAKLLPDPEKRLAFVEDCLHPFFPAATGGPSTDGDVAALRSDLPALFSAVNNTLRVGDFDNSLMRPSLCGSVVAALYPLATREAPGAVKALFVESLAAELDQCRLPGAYFFPAALRSAEEPPLPAVPDAARQLFAMRRGEAAAQQAACVAHVLPDVIFDVVASTLVDLDVRSAAAAFAAATHYEMPGALLLVVQAAHAIAVLQKAATALAALGDGANLDDWLPPAPDNEPINVRAIVLECLGISLMHQQVIHFHTRHPTLKS
jgi:hypothetical protein